MSPKISKLALVVATMSIAFTPTTATGYCIYPAFMPFWASAFPDFVIPVYISTGPETSAEYSGLTFDEIERILVEMISRHNEAATGPILTYAGPTNSDMDYNAASKKLEFDKRPLGITVDSFLCTIPEMYYDPCEEGDPLCTDTAETVARVRVTLRPVGCMNGYGVLIHQLSSNDVATQLLHELGHAMGLQHTNVDKMECENKYVYGSTQGGTGSTVSTMSHITPGTFSAYREWRRDDIDGLRAIYGQGSQVAEVAYWRDDVFPQVPASASLTSLIGAEFGRVPSVTSAVASTGDGQYIATTNNNDQVVLYADAGNGFGPAEIVDLTPAGRTWADVGVALGLDEVLVAWTWGEQAENGSVSTRWALRPNNALNWTYQDALLTSRAKRVRAGYAEGADVFLVIGLTDVDSSPVIRTVDSSAMLLDEAEFMGMSVFDLGTPSCFPQSGLSHCILPYSTNSLDGPDLAWFDLEVTANGFVQVLDDTAIPIAARGSLSAAVLPGEIVFRGTAGIARYELPFLPDVGGANVPSPHPLLAVPTYGWPIRVGSLTAGGMGAQWRGFVRQRVECGDGVIQAGEQCDDGNIIPNDGCSDTCTLDPAGPDLNPGSGTGTGGTGGDGEFPDEGCQCNGTGEPSHRPLGALFLLGVLANLRRRAVDD